MVAGILGIVDALINVVQKEHVLSKLFAIINV
jgi:hypothetical protein